MKRPQGFDSNAWQNSADTAEKVPAAGIADAVESDAENAHRFLPAGNGSRTVSEGESFAASTLGAAGSNAAETKSLFFRWRQNSTESRESYLAKAEQSKLEQSIWDKDHADLSEFEVAATDAVGETGAQEPSVTASDNVTVEQPTVNLDVLAAAAKPSARIREWATSRQRLTHAKKELKAAKRAKSVATKRFYRALSAATRRRLKKLALVLTAALLLALFVVVGIFTPAMSVKQITIVGLQTVNEQDLQQALETLKGKPLALTTDQDVHDAISGFDLIQNYAVERVPPTTLKVVITERTPVLTVKQGENYFVLDSAGVQLAQLTEPAADLPLATVGEVTDGSSKAFSAAAKALREIPNSLRSEIATVTANNTQDIQFGMRNGVQLRWGSAEDSATKAVIYERMLQALAGQQFTLIDVSSTKAPVFK